MTQRLYHGSKSGIVGLIRPSSRSTELTDRIVALREVQDRGGPADMLSRAESQQCRILARVFERAGKAGYDAATMFGVYDGYHTLSPDEAISRLKEEVR